MPSVTPPQNCLQFGNRRPHPAPLRSPCRQSALTRSQRSKIRP